MYCCVLFVFLKARVSYIPGCPPTHYVAENVLKFPVSILLLLAPECWHYSLPCLVYVYAWQPLSQLSHSLIPASVWYLLDLLVTDLWIVWQASFLALMSQRCKRTGHISCMCVYVRSGWRGGLLFSLNSYHLQVLDFPQSSSVCECKGLGLAVFPSLFG